MPRPPIVLPIAPYAPDLPGFPGQAAANVRNVYPRTSVSWGAMPSPTAASSALDGQCTGMGSFLASDGTVNLFAGTLDKLYRIQGSTQTWDDVSKGSGYQGVTGAFWEFTYFNGQVIATNYYDNIQALIIGSASNFADLAAAAPQAKHIAVIKNSFVVVANTNDPSNGQMPQRVWWCAAGDASNWPTPGGQLAAEFQAGATDLLGEHGPINALRTELTAADGLVFQQESLRRMVYVGPPATFDFLPAQNARGTYSPQGPIVVGGTCYFPGYDGFYSCDGASVSPIGSDRINKAFLDDLIPAYYSNIYGAVDPVRQVIWWAYPGQGSMNGIPNHVLGYSYIYDRWCILDVTAEVVGRAFGAGYTLDQLWTILGYTLDDLPAPLDSPVWQGGTQLLAMFDSEHKINYFTGPAMSPTVETQEMEIFPGQRALISGVRPLVDGTNVEKPAIAIKHREVSEATPLITPAVTVNSLGKSPVRTSGRYVRASITIPAGGDWTNISGAEIDAVPQGQR